MRHEQLISTGLGWAKTTGTKFAEWTFSNLSEEHIEFLTLSLERDLLTSRSPGKYDALANALLITSIFNPLTRLYSWKMPTGLYPALEPAYYVGRIVDDVADGHRSLPPGFETFKDWTTHLKQLVNLDWQDIPKEISPEFLLKRAMIRLQPLQRSGDNVSHEFSSFFSAMEVEHDRRINGSVLTTRELQSLNWHSFSHVQNIALIAIRSSTRVKEESGLAILPELLGRGYSVRDLKQDLSDNICNTPKEVLDESRLTLSQLSKDPDLVDNNQTMQNWIASETKDCLTLAQQLTQQKLDLPAKLLTKALTQGLKEDLISL